MDTPVGLLTFCQGVRLISSSKGFTPESFANPLVVSTVAVVGKALENAGKPSSLQEAFERRDPAAVRMEVMGALVDFMEKPTEGIRLWRKLRPDPVLLDRSVFARDAMRVADGRPAAYFSQYAVLRCEQDGSLASIDASRESLLDLVFFSKGFFAGAAFYADIRGAFSIAEQLQWWTVIARENKSSPQDPQVLGRLYKLYSVTGRPATTFRLAALMAASETGASEKILAWKTRLETLSEQAGHLFTDFRKSFDGRQSDAVPLKRKFEMICGEMADDVLTSPLVMAYDLLLTPRDGKWDGEHVTGNTQEEGSRFSNRLSQAQYVPAGNPHYIEMTQHVFHCDNTLHNEPKVYPKPLSELAELHQRIVILLSRFKEHCDGCNQELIKFPSTDVVTLEEWWVKVDGMVRIVQESRQPFSTSDMRLPRLKAALLRLELIHYWSSRYTTPLGQPRGPLDARLAALKEKVASLVHKVVEMMCEASVPDLIEESQVQLRIRSDHDYFAKVPHARDWAPLIAAVMENRWNDTARLLGDPAKFKEWPVKAWRGLIAALLERKEEIESSPRNEQDRETLLIFLENLSTLSPDDVDLSLWICDLQHKAGNEKARHQRLISIFSTAGSHFVLSHLLDQIAPGIIYEDRPPSP